MDNAKHEAGIWDKILKLREIINRGFPALFRSLRRRYLIWFRPQYVLRQMQLRKGECKNCSCCSAINCPYLDKKTRRCTNKPLFPHCLLYPIDDKDKDPNYNCGFWWDETERNYDKYLDNLFKIYIIAMLVLVYAVFAFVFAFLSNRAA